MSTRWISVSALVLALAVICGAFGAHALKGRLDAYGLSVYEKAVFYHFTHGIGLAIVAILPWLGREKPLLDPGSAFWICVMLLAGIFLFSGSLYLLAISGQRWLGAITPLGGTLFILAWLWLARSLA